MSKQLSKEQCIGLLLEQDVFVLNRLVQVVDGFERACVKHPEWPINRYSVDQSFKEKFVKAAAIVAEESGELIRASLQYCDEGGKYEEVEKEAVQTAAVALRFLASSPKA